MGFTLLVVIFFTLAVAESSNNKTNDPISDHNSLIKNMEYGLYMLKNMNKSVDPCDNFYEFACGNFDDPNSPAKKNRYYDEAIDEMVPRLKSLLTNSRRSFKFEPFKFINDYYYSCENINNYHQYIDEDDTEFLNEIISKLGGWPVIQGDNWNETDFNWIKIVDEAMNIGQIRISFYKLYLVQDDGGVKFLLGPPKKNSEGEKSNAYFDFMSDVAIFLGADKDQAEELKLSFKFENDVQKIYNESKSVDGENSEPVKMSVKEMIEKWKSIDWIKYLNSVIKPSFYFTNETIVHIFYPSFITNFEKMMNETPNRVLANYAIWTVIESVIPYINSKTLWNYRKIYMKIEDSSYSTSDSKFDCMALVKTELGMLLHAYYLREYPVDERTRSEVHAIYSNVQNKFIEILNSSKWLDSNAKTEIIDKITFIKTVIGYPDELQNDNELKNYFEGLEITRDNFLKNYLNARMFRGRKKIFSLFNNSSFVESRIDLFTYTYDSPNNAIYKRSRNLISVAVELLRNYFFDIDRFNYLNYGVIGETIGHELSHTVDNEERVIKKTGLKYKWSDLSDDEYQKKETCIINQYKNYSTENKVKLNAKKYLSENIADNVGLKVAYLTYQDWVAQNGHEPSLPGISYTPNQLFWISFANKWCQSKSLLSKVDVKATHPPNDKRVIGPLSNSIEFSKDFNCPVGSNMNPLNKCIFF